MERPKANPTCIKAEVLSDANARAFKRDGYLLVHDALAEGIADRLLGDLENRNYLKVEIDGGRKGVTTFYSKNGPRLFEASPLIQPLEQDMVALASYIADTQYIPLDNRAIGASVNVTPPGGGFQTHFDRQEVSAVIYLNEVAGGELDVWPRLRRWERVCPGYTAQRMTIAMTMVLPPVRLSPRKGSVLLFTRESPHRVAEVRGDRSRVSVVFGLDRPGHTFVDGSAYYGDAEETVQVGALR